MKIYYDSSALLKIYIDEQYSEFIRHYILKHQDNYISTLTYIEIHSVFSRLFNNSQITEEELVFLKNSFNNDYGIFYQVPIDDHILKRAAELTYITNLRTLDSIHLASLESMKYSSGEDILFACFDNKLLEGAITLGFNILKY